MAHSGPEGPDKRLSPEPPTETETLKPAVDILRPLLRDPKQAPQAVARIAVQLFRGPIPPPDDFAGYEHVLPGSARELMDMAKSEQTHRHRMQSLEMLYPYVGMISGVICFGACIAGSVWLAIEGRETVAGLLLGVPCLGLISWFIRSRLPAPSQNADTPSVAKRTS